MNASITHNKVKESFNALVSLINSKRHPDHCDKSDVREDKGGLLSLLGKRPRETKEESYQAEACAQMGTA